MGLPLVGVGQWEEAPRGEGLLPQPKRDILAGVPSLGPTWGVLHPSLRKQTIRGLELRLCMEPEGTREEPGPGRF